MLTYKDCGHPGPKSARGKCAQCQQKGRCAGGNNQRLSSKRKGGIANTMKQRRQRSANLLTAQTSRRKKQARHKKNKISMAIRRRPLLFMAAALLLSPRPLPVFLDIFAGAGGVARASEQYGGYAIRWDIKHGEQYDLQEKKKMWI